MNKTALEAALRPLASLPIGAEIEDDHDLVLYKNAGKSITVGDVLNARAALRSPAPAPAETEEDRALANFDKIKDSFFASNDAMLAAPASPSPATGEA